MAMICFLIILTDSCLGKTLIALVKSQMYSVRRWAFNVRILYLQSLASLIILGYWDVIETNM